jgi:hypothetical protein
VPDAASTAVFRAVANFSSLISQSRAASTALAGTTTAANTAFGARTASMISARGRQMRQFGTTATVGVTAPLILAGGAMIHTYSEFEKTLTQAAGKADATKKEFKQMEDLAIRMGKQTMFSAGEAAGALDNLASLGFNARQSMQALPGVLLSASASGSDLALTADVVAKAINAFGLQAKDSTHLADVFAQASNTTALSMQGLADGLAHAGELGARFGFKVEDVVGMLGRLVDQGVPAASAGMAVGTDAGSRGADQGAGPGHPRRGGESEASPRHRRRGQSCVGCRVAWVQEDAGDGGAVVGRVDGLGEAQRHVHDRREEDAAGRGAGRRRGPRLRDEDAVRD